MAIDTPRNITELMKYGRSVPYPGNPDLRVKRVIILQETTLEDHGPDNYIVVYNQQHYLTEDRKRYIEKVVRGGVPLDEAFWMACFQE